MEHASASFTFAVALGAGVAAQLAARHLRIPSIVLLLATGVTLGPDALGWIAPSALGSGLFALVSLAVAVILFEGGLNLDLGRLRREAAAIRRLVTWGALGTTAGGALAAHAFLGWSPGLCVLFGSLVVVTGPTVIRPLLHNVPLRPRLATVLESEGLLIDPVGAILAAVVLEAVLGATPGVLGESLVGVLERAAFGAIAGGLFGLALSQLLRWHRVVPEGLENLVALGGALLSFALCEAVVAESGILAVTLAGVVVGNREPRVARELGEFQEHLTVGLIGLLFVLLAADVRMADVASLGWPGVLTVAALALLVRPLNVLACTAGSELAAAERAFLAWVAPRGVVAAAIASIAAGLLEARGVPEAAGIRAMVFLTIAATVTIQGGGAGLLARVLRVRAPGRDTWVILGAEELALALGGLIRAGGTRVLFADRNPSHCRVAEEAGYPVVYGDVLDPRTLARMGLSRALGVIGLTANSEVNHHFAGEAGDEYGVRERYVAVEREGSEVTERIVAKQLSRVLFDGPKELERWHVRLRHRMARIHELRFTGAPTATGAREPERAGGDEADPFLVLAMRRNGGWVPMARDTALAADDRLAVAIYDAEEEQALAALRARGMVPGEGDSAQPPGSPEG